jgi:hypothetical protein
MTKRTYAFMILVALALAANIPYMSMAAENTPSSQIPTAQNYAAGQQDQVASPPPSPPALANLSQSGQGGRQAPQPKGGVAIVIGVDHPENCLRIRSGPGGSYDVIGCANMGDQLNITGVWASNDWAQLADNGWVYGPQIQTDLRPPVAAYSRGVSYRVTEVVTPDYDDWACLPDYGYDTYWYEGIPIFFYNIGVWYRFHPWWWHHGYQAWWWKDGHHGRRAWDPTAFHNFARAGAQRNFATNRSNISSRDRAGAPRSFTANRSNVSSASVSRFNTTRFRSGSTNALRSRAFSRPSTFRSGSANAFRARSFSSPRTFRSGSFGGRQFRSFARSGGFSTARMGGRGFRMGGGGFRMGGGGFRMGGGGFRMGGRRR